MKLKDKIFSCDEVNTNRQNELDLARAFIIFCLAFIHVTIECTTDEGLCSGIPYLFDTVIGGPFSAPMYMFVMGVGMCYAKKHKPRDYFIRGFNIFALGYILNICRYTIPYTIGYAITGDYAVYIEPLLYKTLFNDIFTFAGLAMMIIALFKKLNFSNLVMFVIAFVMCIFGELLNGVDAGSPLGNIFLGYLVGTEDAAGMVLSYFPVLNWMMFPVCGYIFGYLLRRVKNKKLFYLIFSLPALIIAIVYFTYGIYNEVGMFGEGQNCYYHMIVSDVVASLCLTLGLIGVYYVISLVLPEKVLKVTSGISRNIRTTYFIHWLFVTYVVNLIMYVIRGTTLLEVWQILVLSTAISVVSMVIAHYFEMWKGRIKKNAKAS